MKLLFTTLMLMTMTATAGEHKETTIKEHDGSTTRVVTDSSGTEVFSNEKSVYTSGGDRHTEQVDQSVNNGGEVVNNSQ